MRVEGWLEESTRNVMLVAEVDQPYVATVGPLRLGTFVEAQLSGRPRDDLYRIPETALQNRNTLWVVDDADLLQALTVAWVFSQGDDVWVHIHDRPKSIRYVVRPHSGLASGVAVAIREVHVQRGDTDTAKEEAATSNE